MHFGVTLLSSCSETCGPGCLKYFRPFFITIREGLEVLLEPAADLNWTCWPSSAPNPSMRNLPHHPNVPDNFAETLCALWLSSSKVDHVVPTEHRTHFIYASLMHYDSITAQHSTSPTQFRHIACSSSRINEW